MNSNYFQIELNSPATKDQEPQLFPDVSPGNQESVITCILLTPDFLIYSTDVSVINRINWIIHRVKISLGLITVPANSSCVHKPFVLTIDHGTRSLSVTRFPSANFPREFSVFHFRASSETSAMKCYRDCDCSSITLSFSLAQRWTILPQRPLIIRLCAFSWAIWHTFRWNIGQQLSIFVIRAASRVFSVTVTARNCCTLTTIIKATFIAR